MVQLSRPADLQPEVGAEKGMGVVKLEVEVEDECSPISKRRRSSGPLPQDLQQEWSASIDAPSQHDQYNPLNEPSPLGLRLRKSPSLVELIQTKLSQSSTSRTAVSVNGSVDSGKHDTSNVNLRGMAEKLKASNFPATSLKIGSWERVSRYEGDLVAKCYFAKHKLVWEVLEGGLKSKIEIQWSDISALKASCPENGSGTLDVVLSRQPLFFRETNPQPRKHTLWQATSDFTGGEASIHRRHFLKCAPGLLSKHFEKLIQCDSRLCSLSHQPEIILDSPYFEPRCSIFEDQDDGKSCGFENRRADRAPSLGIHEASSTCSAPSTSSKSDVREFAGRTPESSSRDTPSPISGIPSSIPDEGTAFQIEQLKNPIEWDQFKVPGLHPAMSMSDLVNHIGNCISEKSSGVPLHPGSPMNRDMLEEIAQYLLSDSNAVGASDETSLMSRVNSLCCLLQNPVTSPSHHKSGNHRNKEKGSENNQEMSTERKPVLDLSLGEGNNKEINPSSTMSRKDSFGELIVDLPRIASMPQFLFNISEDS